MEVSFKDRLSFKNQPFPEHLMDNEVHLVIHLFKLLNIPREALGRLAP